MPAVVHFKSIKELGSCILRTCCTVHLIFQSSSILEFAPEEVKLSIKISEVLTTLLTIIDELFSSGTSPLSKANARIVITIHSLISILVNANIGIGISIEQFARSIITYGLSAGKYSGMTRIRSEIVTLDTIGLITRLRLPTTHRTRDSVVGHAFVLHILPDRGLGFCSAHTGSGTSIELSRHSRVIDESTELISSA